MWGGGLKDLEIYVCACAYTGLKMNLSALGKGEECGRETFITGLC